MTQRAGVWPLVILGILLGMTSPAGADRTGSTRMGGPPALAASAIVYLFVPGVVAGRTWGEEQLDRTRLHGERGFWEDVSEETRYILGILYSPEAETFVIENTDGPLDLDGLGPEIGGAVFRKTRVQGALAAAGLRVEDLVSPVDVPGMAVTLADLFFSLYRRALEVALRLRMLVRGESALSGGVPQVEAKNLFKRGAGLTGDGPGAAFSKSHEQPIILAKRVARSLFKIFLGVGIGLFIWNFVRRM